MLSYILFIKFILQSKINKEKYSIISIVLLIIIISRHNHRFPQTLLQADNFIKTNRVDKLFSGNWQNRGYAQTSQ